MIKPWIFDFCSPPQEDFANAQAQEAPARTRQAAFPGKTLETLRDPTYSPLYANLKDLPPAIFTVGTADAVLDDSLFMASRWQAAGNEAQLAVYPEAPHLFIAYPTAMAAEARKRIAGFLAGLA